jgi:hypothetical protein
MSICGRGRALMCQICPGGYVGNLVVDRATGIQGYDGAYQRVVTITIRLSSLTSDCIEVPAGKARPSL